MGMNIESLVAASATASGVPVKVTDKGVLRAVAGMLA